MNSIPYPVGYYPPRYIESRSDDPRISPSTHQLLARSVTAASNLEQFILPTTKPPENVNAIQSVRTHQKNSRIHNPIEQNIPKSIVNENTVKQPVRSSTYSMINPDKKNIESNNIPKVYTNESLPNKTKIQTASPELIKKKQQQQQQPIVNVVEDTQPIDGYWKTGTLFNSQGIVAIGPVIYNEEPYAGPFGLNRAGAYIYYISICVFILVAGIFLIMTATFYSQKYPNSSTNPGTLAGVFICLFAVYVGIQLILVGIWSQKYRQENPKRKIPNKKPRLIYTPYGYYLYPQYFTNINKQTLSQRHDTSSVDANAKILQPTKPVEVPTRKPIEVLLPKPIEILPPKPEFYSIQSSLDIVKQQPPSESIANGKTGSTTLTLEINQTTKKSSNDIDKLSNTKKRLKPIDNKPVVSSSNDHATQVPVAHRTLIVKPHLAQPSAKIAITPREGSNGEYGIIGDIQIENINDQDIKIKKNKTSMNNTIKNAFYN